MTFIVFVRFAFCKFFRELGYNALERFGTIMCQRRPEFRVLEHQFHIAKSRRTTETEKRPACTGRFQAKLANQFLSSTTYEEEVINRLSVREPILVFDDHDHLKNGITIETTGSVG